MAAEQRAEQQINGSCMLTTRSIMPSAAEALLVRLALFSPLALATLGLFSLLPPLLAACADMHDMHLSA